jgi:outer membrane receptor for ferrienterochelin and colicins
MHFLYKSKCFQKISFSLKLNITIKMNKLHLYTTLLTLSLLINTLAWGSNSAPEVRLKTDANLVGHVVNEGKHLPFVTISVKGTSIGTVSDETGHFRLLHMPVGKHTIVASFMGYKPQEIEVLAVEKETQEINFHLEYDALGLEEIVVTGDRNERKRSESPVIVSSLGPKLFNSTHSVNLGEALNFAPGLRMENNCQNCGFTQVRMNGLEGPYSQVLINSRKIFSGLAGVYGLELIPSNMIERIEVVRGGGSAIYGSNAIAGTINVILKDPMINSYEVGFGSGISGIGMQNAGPGAPDSNISFNSSIISADSRTGLSLFGHHRERSPFDANGDDFSEMGMIKNTTLGARLFHRFGMRGKLAVDFFNISEERRGGNDFDKLPHMSVITESAGHKITTGALNYNQFFRSTDLLNVFASAQHINRDTYYGANQSLADYGNTLNLTYNTGVQYKALFGKSILTAGTEISGETMLDQKLGFPEINPDKPGEMIYSENTIVADQTITIAGVFAQYDINFDKLLVSVGGRFDNYRVEDKEKQFEPKTGNVFSPRVNLLYKLVPGLQARAGWSTGYRAPQIFDEDLHILTSGARQVLHSNDPDLKAETSSSYMASLDYNRLIGNTYASLLVEGFYTRLQDPFVLDYGEPDANGVVEYTRQNADGSAQVSGINTELSVVPGRKLRLSAGVTIQQAMYSEVHEFDEKRFFKSPNHYGFISADFSIKKRWELALTGNYTGSMLVPYFGPELENPEDGELRTSNPFFDMGSRISYKASINNTGIEIFTGIKNIFNSYQKDFDITADRDPGYMYGPNLPRTIYFGVRVGNLLR